jgi:hypothetical protein
MRKRDEKYVRILVENAEKLAENQQWDELETYARLVTGQSKIYEHSENHKYRNGDDAIEAIYDAINELNESEVRVLAYSCQQRPVK